MTESRIEKIYNEFVLPLFEENQIEDTTETRLAAMLGLQAAWKETEVDSDEVFEKILYQQAVNSEIFILKMKLMFPSIYA